MKIEIVDLVKSYRDIQVLKGINLTIEEGMFGLLGPNGAGKTTLMRILTTLVSKTRGKIEIDGINIESKKEIRRILGYLPQEFSLYPELTVYECMDYLAVLSGIENRNDRRSKIYNLLEKVNLYDNMKTKTKALSGGMKRRLGIAQALINDPKLLVVDEPTAGLDPEERIRFRNLLSEFSNGRIVIFSTHIVEDIESTCDNLAIINQGNIMFKGGINELIKYAEGKVWAAHIDTSALNNMKAQYTILSHINEGRYTRVKFLSEKQPEIKCEQVPPSIEDAYMLYMKGGNHNAFTTFYNGV